MTSPYFGWTRHRPPQEGDIVYPWGNQARAQIIGISETERGVRLYLVEYIDDSVATIHWWMKILIFPAGTRLELYDGDISGYPLR